MFLEVQHIVKSFGAEKVVKDLSFSLQAKQTLSILGKSGCGKTTMLKTIGGLISPDSGKILLNGVDITETKPEKRNIVYLYQEDLLFPHLNAFENIAFGLRIKKIPEGLIKEKVQHMLHSLELEGQADKMPTQLSGGQRQRVSFGRAISTNPSLLLLDEPFGSLDTGTRQRMQELFKKLTEEFDITSLFVTHDLKEAVLMGNQIGFMQDGVLKVYEDKKDFIQDPQTGVQSEIEFWGGLK
ncbi:ATP-binding cassette domain-containing protein [Zobellia amurskyensis]|uniref:ATP-binding cassette domain-containing protein n=1 Tax=Zobellia amurskyensis TaxID=248905 RepID=A0A7X2ZRL5_9FLAO|nr:ABC transporter ATP-binding protein [Zobellia amurskyensis]MUH35107.1 ATP-binding cassette domain-containing protein [Zobellia amurskyensis]